MVRKAHEEVDERLILDNEGNNFYDRIKDYEERVKETFDKTKQNIMKDDADFII